MCAVRRGVSAHSASYGGGSNQPVAMATIRYVTVRGRGVASAGLFTVPVCFCVCVCVCLCVCVCMCVCVHAYHDNMCIIMSASWCLW